MYGESVCKDNKNLIKKVMGYKVTDKWKIGNHE